MVDKVSYQIINMQGKSAGNADLHPDVFDADVDSSVLHSVVRWQRNKKRSGTHATLNTAKMTGTKHKPYKQKGTGRARAGSRVSPLMRGGSVIHGPQPRSYEFDINKKTKKAALAGALTAKCRQKELILLDQLENSSAKTKEMNSILTKIGAADSKALILVSGDSSNEGENQVIRSAKNIKGVKLLNISGLNVYDILNAKYLICPVACLDKVQARVLGNQEQ